MAKVTVPSSRWPMMKASPPDPGCPEPFRARRDHNPSLFLLI